MSAWLKNVSLSGRILMCQSAVLRLPQVAFEQKRAASFPQGIKRNARPKGRKPVPVENVKPVTLSNLYANEISKEVFEAREKDLPEEGMENPFVHQRRQCILCKHNITPDYKNVKLLSQFVSSHTGEVYGRHITGLCRDQQDRVEKEIKKSRTSGLMAYYYKHPEFLKDPKLCDPTRPKRPHPY